MNPVRIAFIGFGSVTQSVHLPVFRDMPEEFVVTDVCDLSPSLLKRAAARISGVRTWTDRHEMLASGGFDAVAVVNSDEYHCDCAVEALQAGYHVLIEKPIVLTLPDLNRVIEAERASGKVAMTGYMRRFAGGFETMRNAIREMDVIRHASVRDYIGPNSYFLSQVSDEMRASDIPAEAIADKERRRRQMTEEALGGYSEEMAAAYALLCGLSSHDLSAMRDLLGTPLGVAGATVRANGRQISALFDYGDFVANFETGVDLVGDFDAFIEVFGVDRRARIDYDTPFIRHLPTTVTIKKTSGQRHTETVERETYTDPYTRQWRVFAQVIRGERQNPTPPRDSEDDLKLFRKIVDAARR